MDDGDLGEYIDHHADVAENELPVGSRVKNDDAHLDPTRWWFASSALPMIASTLGPVASAFSICALVRPWRQRLHGGANPQHAPFIPDPVWLTTINAVQLMVALVANVFLLLNMTKRVRFTIAQPITIVGWYFSTICLMVLTATAAGPLKDSFKGPMSELMWSQAFYYGIWSAILYFIDASFMVVTFWGAYTDHYDKEFQLTASQRTLMLQTIMFLMYLLLGALVFSSIEHWNYLDAIYWADVTLFTVGFGDYAMSTSLGRALLFPYALIGVISLGLVIGSIRSMLLERGRRRVDARLEEKRRRTVVRSMTMKGNVDILRPMDQPTNTQSLQPDRPLDSDSPGNEFERRKAEFELMRKIQFQAATRRKWVALAVSVGTWLVLWLVGAVIFLEAEKPYQPQFNYYDAFYFCFVTFTTIGYGDVTPISNCGKSFFVFWSLLALPTMTVLISNAGDTVVKFVRDGTIRLGNLTILPGEEGFSRDIKHVIHRLTFGRVFPDFTEPVNVVSKQGAYQSAYERRMSRKSEEAARDLERNLDEDAEDDRSSGISNTNLALGQGIGSIRRAWRHRPESTFTTRARRSLSRLRDPREELPTGTDFYFLLVCEIEAVNHSLRESEPRRYTFEEWAWYLKLIGEDESRPEMHRMAQPHKKGERPGQSSNSDEELKWSWVGNHSPLMGSQEESEWILDKLTERLKEALSSEGRQRKLANVFSGAHKRMKGSQDANADANSSNEKKG